MPTLKEYYENLTPLIFNPDHIWTVKTISETEIEIRFIDDTTLILIKL